MVLVFQLSCLRDTSFPWACPIPYLKFCLADIQWLRQLYTLGSPVQLTFHFHSLRKSLLRPSCPLKVFIQELLCHITWSQETFLNHRGRFNKHFTNTFFMSTERGKERILMFSLKPEPCGLN